MNFAFFTDIEQLKNVNPKKTSQDMDIPTRILKENSNLFAKFVLRNYNEVITTSIFLNVLKHPNARTVYKKDSKNKVQNYCPVSILSSLCKAHEKCLFNEMTTHFDDILSKYQRGFRIGFSSHQRLFVLVDKWKKIEQKKAVLR